MKLLKVNHEALACRFAPVMFSASLVFLILLAALIVVWVDIPRFQIVEQALSQSSAPIDENQQIVDPLSDSVRHVGIFLCYGLLALWALITCEVVLQMYISVRSAEPINIGRWRIFAALQCICPPLRLAAPNIAMHGKIWFPVIGWQKPSRELSKQLTEAFSKPMLFISLLILPLLLVEFLLHKVVLTTPWLRITIHVCTGFIWCAFAIEFIVLVAASERRIRYVKQNWIDLAIIVLPIVLFLRSLRIVRLVKFAKFAKVQQLTKLARVYRVRGVAMKLLRAVMLLEFFGRVINGRPEKRLQRLEMDYRDKQEELNDIAQEIAKVKLLIQQRQASAQLPDSSNGDSAGSVVE